MAWKLCRVYPVAALVDVVVVAGYGSAVIDGHGQEGGVALAPVAEDEAVAPSHHLSNSTSMPVHYP